MLSFLVFVPPLADPSALVSEVIDTPPEEDSPADAESVPPSTKEVLAEDATIPEVLPHATPSPAAMGPRRSMRENRGVPPIRMADVRMQPGKCILN